MKAIEKTKKYDINLINPYATIYTAIATSKKRVIEMLSAELQQDTDNSYKLEDFEIEERGEAKDQLGYYFDERFRREM